MAIVKFNNRNFPVWNSVFDELFDHSFVTDRLARKEKSTLPPVNISETEGAFNLELSLPGFNKAGINIELEENSLKISSESKVEGEEEKTDYRIKEFGFSSFERTFKLPDSVNKDDIKAEFQDGILKLKLLKLEPEVSKLKKISIT